jgi:hypothetical protein
MKKTTTIIWWILVGILALSPACDFVDPPYFDSVTLDDVELDRECLEKIPADPFAEPPVRKVLFEEYTGHKCVNCPEASEIAYRLAAETYKDRAFLVSVHATGLAEPDPAPSKYTEDYTTEAGDEYKSHFQVVAVPLGLINRQLRSNGRYFFTDGEWNAAISNELELEPEVQIHITNCYDEASRDLKVVADIKYLTDASDQEYYSVWLVEDSITGWQKDGRRTPQDVENYVFHDVFRGSLNGTWGQPLNDGTVANEGDIFRKAIGYTVPDNYDPRHCKILVFIHDFETRRIRQVEEAYILE